MNPSLLEINLLLLVLLSFIRDLVEPMDKSIGTDAHPVVLTLATFVDGSRWRVTSETATCITTGTFFFEGLEFTRQEFMVSFQG